MNDLERAKAAIARADVIAELSRKRLPRSEAGGDGRAEGAWLISASCSASPSLQWCSPAAAYIREFVRRRAR